MKGRHLAILVAVLPLLGGACAGVSSDLNREVPAPRTLAVLPVRGTLSFSDRELVRRRLEAGLSAAQLAVVENRWVDRVLSARGWMADPAEFTMSGLDPAQVCKALGVDGIVIPEGFRTSAVNIVVFYREGLGGQVRMVNSDGKLYWSADYFAGRSGGLLVGMGQLFTAVREQFETNARVAFPLRLEDYATAVLATLPHPDATQLPPIKRPKIEKLAVTGVGPESTIPAGTRITVDVSASPSALVTIDLAPGISRLPTVEHQPGRYRGIFELPYPIDRGQLAVIARIRDRDGITGVPGGKS